MAARSHAPVLVGVIHLPPLLGSARASLEPHDVARAAADDASALLEAGFGYVLIENFGDNPFFKTNVPPATVSAMTACAIAIRERAPELRFGINVLRNDAAAALSIAKVTGGSFVRVNVHVGARVTDQGVIEGDAAGTLRLRRALSAEAVEIWADVDVKHSAAVAKMPIEQEVHDLLERAMADALLVTGDGTGLAVEAATLKRVREAAPHARVLVASGTTCTNLPALAPHCDGVIVGSALREDGRAGQPIRAKVAERFVRAFQEAFAD